MTLKEFFSKHLLNKSKITVFIYRVVSADNGLFHFISIRGGGGGRVNVKF